MVKGKDNRAPGQARDRLTEGWAEGRAEQERTSQRCSPGWATAAHRSNESTCTVKEARAHAEIAEIAEGGKESVQSGNRKETGSWKLEAGMKTGHLARMKKNHLPPRVQPMPKTILDSVFELASSLISQGTALMSFLPSPR